MNTYQELKENADNHLDAAGIGHDVQKRLEAITSQCADFAARVSKNATLQALHNELTNRPCNISVGPDSAKMACIHGAITALAFLADYEIYAARLIAADLLEDVNDHDTARLLRSLISESYPGSKAGRTGKTESCE